MFKNFTGFHLVDSLHKMTVDVRRQLPWLRRKTFEMMAVAAVTLILWFIPTSAFGIDGLTVVQHVGGD